MNLSIMRPNGRGVLEFACVVLLISNACAFIPLLSDRYRVRPLTAEYDASSGPYADGLLTAAETIRHRFFFPGHGGCPQYDSSSASSIITSWAKYDLPELDETDNLHAPSVTAFVSSMFCLFPSYDFSSPSGNPSHIA